MKGINCILGHIARRTIRPETRREPGPLSPGTIASEIRPLSDQDEPWRSWKEVDHAPVTGHWLPSHKPIQPTSRLNPGDHTKGLVNAAEGT